MTLHSAGNEFTFRWATPSRWPDVEKLFGERGACAGCWCMVWRRNRKDYDAGKGAGNKRAFKKLVTESARPGVIAYHGRDAVAWCAVAPRDEYPFLGRSRVLAAVDGEPVWSISCLFVDRAWRRRGVSAALLRATAEMARARGARVIEGYPVATPTTKSPDAFIWTGTESAFARAGFVEVARRSPTRPIMRFAR